MIAEVDGKIALNREKWYRVAKKGEKPTKAHMDAYILLGGAVIDSRVTEVKTAKKTVKKVAKKKK